MPLINSTPDTKDNINWAMHRWWRYINFQKCLWWIPTKISEVHWLIIYPSPLQMNPFKMFANKITIYNAFVTDMQLEWLCDALFWSRNQEGEKYFILFAEDVWKHAAVEIIRSSKYCGDVASEESLFANLTLLCDGDTFTTTKLRQHQKLFVL